MAEINKTTVKSQPAVNPEQVKETAPANEPKEENGFIAAKTKIEGNVKTEGHLSVLGTVNGDIDAKGDVTISGTVSGSIKCRHITINSNLEKANINASGLVTIQTGVTVKGNVNCRDLQLFGTLDGDVKAKSEVGVSKEAKISGNVSAAYIGVEMGARISGKLDIK